MRTCINRNIVECKVDKNIKLVNAGLRINRNIVECKDVSCQSHLRSLLRINRNIVECKVLSLSHTRYFISVLIET